MIAALLIAATLSAGTCDLAAAQAVVDDVNGHRNEARVQALVVDPQLTAVAMDRAADLVRRHYFAHVSPDGTTALDALRSRDVRFGYAGENLAEAEDVQAAELGLWESPELRDNMLGARYKRMGIAVVRTDDGEIVVQIFTD